MLPALAALVLLLVAALAGCVTQPLAPPPGLLLPQPWRENWTSTGGDFVVDLDPAAHTMAVEGTLRMRNDVGRDLPYALLRLEPVDLTYVRDEAGRDLGFELQADGVVERPGDDVLAPVQGIRVYNVTLDGPVGPGATRTLTLGYAGWGGRDQIALGGGAPNEFGAPRLQLTPALEAIAIGSAQAPTNVTLRHPADWTVLATAEPLDTAVDGPTVVTRYTSRVLEVVAVMAQGLESLQESVEGIEVRTYFFPDMRVQGQTVHDITRHALTVLPSLTGPYPFGHLWTVPNQIRSNAFSTPGLTFLGLQFYRFDLPGVPVQFSRAAFPAPVPGGQDMYESVVVHEHTHNWWGHNVAGNNTNATHGPVEWWVTEGVTTYLSELVWMKTQYGESEGALVARDRALDCLRARTANGGEEIAITEAGGLGYSKAAMALRALEAYAIQRGTPEAVFDGLQLVQQRYGRLAGGPGVATSAQFFDIFAEVFGEDLTWHFEPWFFGRELSDFAIESAQRADGNVTVRVANTGAVPAAVQLRATSVTGREFHAWGFVPGAASADVAVPLPAGFAEPIVRIEADPHQYVYEWDDTDNVWVGAA